MLFKSKQHRKKAKHVLSYKLILVIGIFFYFQAKITKIKIRGRVILPWGIGSLSFVKHKGTSQHHLLLARVSVLKGWPEMCMSLPFHTTKILAFHTVLAAKAVAGWTLQQELATVSNIKLFLLVTVGTTTHSWWDKGASVRMFLMDQ